MPGWQAGIVNEKKEGLTPNKVGYYKRSLIVNDFVRRKGLRYDKQRQRLKGNRVLVGRLKTEIVTNRFQ